MKNRKQEMISALCAMTPYGKAMFNIVGIVININTMNQGRTLVKMG